MKYTLLILFVWFALLGCLDTATDPRPGPFQESDAEIFDVRPPPTANNTGSGYGGSGTYQSGAYGESSTAPGEDATVGEAALDAEWFQDAGMVLDAGEVDDSDEDEDIDE